MADDHRDNVNPQPSPQTLWNHATRINPQPQQGTLAQEYSDFGFTTPHMAMENGTFEAATQQISMAPPYIAMDAGTFDAGIQQLSMAPSLQPLVMPPWPSMLSSPLYSTFQPGYQPSVHSIPPNTPGTTSTRAEKRQSRTMTDLQRKLICQYAEDHPNSKQTEIAAIFGIERSTVSKVLRNKEKWLDQDNKSRSLNEGAKERTSSPLLRGPNQALPSTVLSSGAVPGTFLRRLAARPTAPETTSTTVDVQTRRSPISPLPERCTTGSTNESTMAFQRVPDTVLDSFTEESHSPSTDMHEATRSSQVEERPHAATPVNTLQPARLPLSPASGQSAPTERNPIPQTPTGSQHPSVSPEEAKQALEVVMTFIEQQGADYLNFQESVHMGMLAEKLKTSSQSDT